MMVTLQAGKCYTLVGFSAPGAGRRRGPEPARAAALHDAGGAGPHAQQHAGHRRLTQRRCARSSPSRCSTSSTSSRNKGSGIVAVQLYSKNEGRREIAGEARRIRDLLVMNKTTANLLALCALTGARSRCLRWRLRRAASQAGRQRRRAAARHRAARAPSASRTRSRGPGRTPRARRGDDATRLTARAGRSHRLRCRSRRSSRRRARPRGDAQAGRRHGSDCWQRASARPRRSSRRRCSPTARSRRAASRRSSTFRPTSRWSRASATRSSASRKKVKDLDLYLLLPPGILSART